MIGFKLAAEGDDPLTSFDGFVFFSCVWFDHERYFIMSEKC